MAYKVCENCKEENPENASVCSGCSHPLHNAKVFGTPMNEKQAAPPKAKICSGCKERLDPGALQCKYCGQVAISNPSDSRYSNRSYSAPASDHSAAIILLFIATFFIPIVGLIVGGFYALHDDPEKSSVGKGLVIFGLVMLVLGTILWNILF
ncbi:zinc ribbon domain-containing protein [Paenibacillus sp. 32352]|uniref:double zinc ribbon domain-containing protein n=1 Tax=Paenibacillus sp. 32352 TaxID=1969111 RepID=UPI0009AE8DB9|nr:zinc ribbon domain-containing protein [Paenibacillus sp. 32352]